MYRMNNFRKIKNRIYQSCKFIIYSRPIYSLWFNFRYLPFKQAKKLPIIFYPHAFAKVEKGAKIIIGDEVLNHKNKKISIGEDVPDFAHFSEKTYLHIVGKLILSGKTRILRGASIEILGTLSLGDDVSIGSLSRIRAFNNISLGNCIRMAHETQLFDTNFHYVVDVENPEFRPMSKPIAIGDYVWIGNRSTVTGGGVIPSHTIVASNSLVNKDMSTIKPYTIIGGIPCKILAEGKTRVWDASLEDKYWFKEYNGILNTI